jgi:hypothetical protein
MTKIKLYHFGRVVNGVKKYYDTNLQQGQLALLEGKEFQEYIEEKLYKPTTDQHGYYRAGIIGECLESETYGGWSRDEIDDFFCDMFLCYNVVKTYRKKSGPEITKQVRIKVSTGDISKKEMQEFIDKVIDYLLIEDNIKIKSPEEYYYGKYQSTN